MTAEELIKKAVAMRAGQKNKGLAMVSGLHRNTIANIERGRDVKLSSFLQYCEAIGIDVYLIEKGVLK